MSTHGVNPARTVSDRVKIARRHAGLKQHELAERAGVSQAAISDLESGRSQRSAYLPEIAVECGVDIHWLAFGVSAEWRGENPEQMTELESVKTENAFFRKVIADFIEAVSAKEPSHG